MRPDYMYVYLIVCANESNVFLIVLRYEDAQTVGWLNTHVMI